MRPRVAAVIAWLEQTCGDEDIAGLHLLDALKEALEHKEAQGPKQLRAGGGWACSTRRLSGGGCAQCDTIDYLDAMLYQLEVQE